METSGGQAEKRPQFAGRRSELLDLNSPTGRHTIACRKLDYEQIADVCTALFHKAIDRILESLFDAGRHNKVPQQLKR
jgi:hypothetical protein